MNKVILIGRLTKDPELRKTPTDVSVCQFTIAVNRPFQQQNGERQADFINIGTYSMLADFVEKYLGQGRQICVSGRIQTRNWEDNNGIKRYATEIIAEEIDFADSPKKADESILWATPANNNQIANNTDDGVITGDGDDLPF